MEEPVTFLPTSKKRIPIIIRKTIANDYNNTKTNKRGNTNPNSNAENNQQNPLVKNEEIKQSGTQNEEQSQVTATQSLTISIKINNTSTTIFFNRSTDNNDKNI